MTKQCPLCNGLISIDRHCTYCHQQLEDTGSLSNYAGPYSPYLEQIVSNQCVHIAACPSCGYDEKVFIDPVSL
ncbi:hypothetical protein MFMK1_001539 [Metallumcola ferriviriculae]|uniref:DZANK-type domain-containing protein n=1 Tax=Metallumcola ferriviriculae TaxID=3039180 RepID=A0AAU0UNH2_9FIRM|nr:hypothetical protein MFMK1_001539 [Desulfitibacteraceae bacterium MK1]